jgi:PqqD family protein of HPr-rel-A system
MSAGPIAVETSWHASADYIVFQNVGEIVAAFNRRSGDTHILNFLSKAIVDCLCREPATATALMSAVLAEIGMEAADMPEGLLEKTLLELDDIGLIEPIREVKP